MSTVIEGGAGGAAGDKGAGAGSEGAGAGAAAGAAEKVAGAGAAGDGDKGAAAGAGGAATEGADKGAGSEGGDKADWRSQWAKLVEPDKLSDKASEIFKRFNSDADAVKALVNGQAKIQEQAEAMKGMVKIPGADAKHEDVEAVYKALGRPDKAEDYKIYRPEGIDADEATVAREKLAATKLHALGLNQKQVDGVLKDLYYPLAVQAQKEAEESRAAHGKKVADETRRALGKEWGSDYDTNIGIAHAAAAKVFGKSFENLRNVELADGTLLGDSTDFVRGLAQLGRDMADDGLLIVSESVPVGQNVDKRVNEIMDLLKTDRKKYQSDAVQKELKALTEIQAKRSQRKSG